MTKEKQFGRDGARARCSDLYDLAPVGYCTLSEKGLILAKALLEKRAGRQGPGGAGS